MSDRHFWQWDQDHQVMIQVFLVFFPKQCGCCPAMIFEITQKIAELFFCCQNPWFCCFDKCLFQPSNFSSFVLNNRGYSQCVKGPFLAPKTTNSWKALKKVNFYFCVKIDFVFEFSRLNWSKIAISSEGTQKQIYDLMTSQTTSHIWAPWGAKHS